jgi:hypothetical protein
MRDCRPVAAENRLCRVEDERGDVQGRRRLKRAASFVAALAEKPIAPSPVPAHRTGRDHFGHPALGRVSHGDMRRTPIGRIERRHAQFPKHALRGKLTGSKTADLMPAPEKFADRVVDIEVYRVPRL